MDAQPYIRRLLSYIESNDYAGYDPYDALNSPFLKMLSKKSKWARIAFTQVLRRFPIDLRGVLGVTKGHNPKGLGLFLSAYAKLYAVEKRPEHLEKIDYLISLLERSRSVGYSGNAWGYNFDWQSRVVYRPKFTPTIVNTSFIGHALLDTYEITGKKHALEMALAIEDFIVKDLNRKKEGDVFCFSYTPIDHDYVHNANALGASLLIRLYKLTGTKELRQTALDSLGYCFKHQREDGAWTYAQTNLQQWVDSFHTGFILESIRYFLRLGEASGWKEHYKRGVNYYANNFFLEDGTPKYYNNMIYPIDIHSPAEAVYFFSREGVEYNNLTEMIMTWMITNMWDKSGYFYFRKTQHFTNKISYIRWSQSWGLRALTEYYLKNSIM
jgi:hypothetical protein